MPAPLRPVTTVSPAPSCDLGRLVGAEVAQGEPRGDHRRSRMAGGYTFSRIGIRRYTNPLPSAASISPGRSGEISLSSTSPDSTASRPSRRNSGLKPISSGSPRNGHRQRLARLADVGRPRRHRQLALAERQPQRRVLLRQQA